MTSLIYLENQELYTSEAKFIEFKQTEKGQAIILEQTIFYPQGGGQPADTGKISSENAVFIVEDVRMDADGTVYHFGQFESGELTENETVKLEIDKDKRILNTKLHSAGHLIHTALEKLEKTDLVPGKGCSFPDQAFVQYEGTIEEDLQDFKSKLEKTINELVEEDLKMEIENLTQEQAEEKGYKAPPGKSVRILGFEGFEKIGCGGTHVKSSKEISQVTIKKLSCKKGKTTISYTLN